MIYVTFDEAGNLTGCYRQDVLVEHAERHLEVSEEQALAWPNLMVQEVDDVVDVDGMPTTVTTRTLVGRPVEVPAQTVPAAVTMRQARLALLAAGKLDTVQTTIAGLTGELGDRARIEWEFSSEVRRQQPLVIDLMPALGLTEQQLDELFILAATL